MCVGDGEGTGGCVGGGGVGGERRGEVVHCNQTN